MLDTQTLKILKHINKNPNVSLKTLTAKFGESCKDSTKLLQKNDFISNESAGYHPTAFVPMYKNIFRILPQGKAYLQSISKERIKYWVPIIIADLLSAAAIVVSILK
jgi:hypothetical protein